jgi:molybdate transport system substrate-binding protein
MRKTAVIVLAILGFVFSGCGKESAPPAPAQTQSTLNVFAAASLTESFGEIGKRFEAENPGVAVQFNFAGSQDLRAQLENGAKADLFASANEKEMDTATSESLVDPQTVHDFAHNRLVVIFPKNNPAKIGALADLGKPGVKIDLADVSVPVGKYTRSMLDKMSKDPAYGPDYEKQFLANVVSREENVKAVLTKVRLGEVDAGVVYVTDVTPEASKDVGTLDVPDSFNQIASYPIAVVAKSAQPDLAGKFENLVLSSEGQGILSGYNFVPVSAGAH